MGENDGGGHDGPGQRTPAHFVDAGDEAEPLVAKLFFQA
jgi:hypothetical protein